MNESLAKTKSSVQVVEIKEDQDGQRLDNFLLRALGDIPKSMIYRIIRKGEVRVNKGRIKPNHRLKTGDFVRIPPVRHDTESSEVKLPQSLLGEVGRQILFENNDYMVVNKPSGLAVHGGSGLRFGLIDVIRAIRPQHEYLELVHRLDRETSGCLLFAKNRQALIFMHEQFKQNQVIKKYLAGIEGEWKSGTKTISAPLIKNATQGGERIVEVNDKGKEAISHFKLVQQFNRLSLIEVELQTGRTHQIRVHAAHEGHPVAGDKKYGNKNYNQWIKEKGLKRLFLHSHWLEFYLPGDNERTQINTPLPDELQVVLSNLESCNK